MTAEYLARGWMVVNCITESLIYMLHTYNRCYKEVCEPNWQEMLFAFFNSFCLLKVVLFFLEVLTNIESLWLISTFLKNDFFTLYARSVHNPFYYFLVFH